MASLVLKMSVSLDGYVAPADGSAFGVTLRTSEGQDRGAADAQVDASDQEATIDAHDLQVLENVLDDTPADAHTRRRLLQVAASSPCASGRFPGDPVASGVGLDTGFPPAADEYDVIVIDR